MKKTLLASIFLLLCCISTSAQTARLQSKPKRFTVDLLITGKDAQLEAEVNRYLSRELRSLGDVDVVKSGVFTIAIIVLRTTTKSGELTGYAVATSYLEPAYVPSQGKVYLDYLHGALDIADEDSLRKICADIVTEFDTRILAKRR